MSFLGKLHEISFYGLISTVICLCTGKTTVSALWAGKLDVVNFPTFFLAVLFWACVLFIPIAVIAALATKHADGGKGLLFQSDNLFVIFFAHIAEEIMGLLLTPFWFLIDFFRKRLDDDGKKIDYITYVMEILFFTFGILVL